MSHNKLNEGKKARSTNLNFEKKELLLKIAISKKNILENKRSNATLWKDKNACWVEIMGLFNSATTGCVIKLNTIWSLYIDFLKIYKLIIFFLL